MLALILAACAVLQGERAPVPDAAAQKEKEKVLREVFKTEYARKTGPERSAFARTLLRQAIDTKDDPATRYVMLREARDLALQAADAATAADAVAELTRSFDVDAVRMKLAVLTTLAQDARTPESGRSAAEGLLRLVDEAESTEDVEAQEKAVALAISTARRIKDAALAARGEARQKEVADLKAKLLRVKAARETLAANPDDPTANLEVGQLECFYRGKWAAGLPLLAKGSNEPLKLLALQDLSNPEQVAEQIQLGDAWKERAEKDAGVRQRLRDRAVYWYEKAAAAATGVQKLKVDKALTDLTGARSRDVSPLGLVGWWKLDEGSGATADDASGHRNTGKLGGGAEWGQGKVGRAVRLDGREARVSIPDAPSLRITGDLTVALWFKKEAVPGEWSRLVGKGDYNNRNYNLWLGAAHQNHAVHWQQWDANQKNVVEIYSKFHSEMGKWVHVAGVVKGDAALLYIDGKLDTLAKRVGTPQVSPDPVTIGYSGQGIPFSGLIDDVRIYSRALTEGEIQALAAMK